MDVLLAEVLAHYSRLGKDPATKDHAWFMAKLFAKDHPAFFWRLPDLLVKEMQSDPNRIPNRADGVPSDPALPGGRSREECLPGSPVDRKAADVPRDVRRKAGSPASTSFGARR
jgi:hypothetical protein